MFYAGLRVLNSLSTGDKSKPRLARQDYQDPAPRVPVSVFLRRKNLEFFGKRKSRGKNLARGHKKSASRIRAQLHSIAMVSNFFRKVKMAYPVFLCHGVRAAPGTCTLKLVTCVSLSQSCARSLSSASHHCV